MKLVYQHVYTELCNITFYSLEELNAAIAAKMKAHNRKRMQHPYSREEHFLAIEKPALKLLPTNIFEIKSYTTLKVAINGSIYLGRNKHYYSASYGYIHQSVKVIYTRTFVREHLASHSRMYRERSKEYYINRAYAIMTEFGEMVRYMFLTASQPEEVYYKDYDGLLHLSRTTDPMLFRRVCETALTYQRYSYSLINNLVKSKCKGVDELSISGFESLSPPHEHRNIRKKMSLNNHPSLIKKRIEMDEIANQLKSMRLPSIANCWAIFIGNAQSDGVIFRQWTATTFAGRTRR